MTLLLAAWVAAVDSMITPSTSAATAVAPHEDMPADVREIFDEAATVFDTSPRSSAALLRLSIQVLMPHLGETGKNINSDIASLVRKGLEPPIQQALDIVRVIGNNAVHPGEISVNDNRSTATALFGLVNLIVESQIARPNQIDSLFKALPSNALEAIEKRDGAQDTRQGKGTGK